jgi:hypothetical protein
MNEFISQISRIKTMMAVNEDFQNNPSVAVIGDQIAYLLDNSDLLRPFELIDPEMTIDELTEKLVVHEPYENINQVFFSIGTNDMFEPDSSITTLINEMFRVFPNAELYLMKGYIDIDEYDLTEDEVLELEENAIVFYNLIKKDKVKVVGDYPLIGDERLIKGSKVISNLKSYIDAFISPMSDIATIDNEPLMKPEVFVDLDIDEDADFDTIYEFLENFEDIVNSGNDYSTDMSSDYMGDIEMIQVALKFLGYSNINTDGRYTQNTERAVRDFQADNGLSMTGVADDETLESIFYELKIKGFDDNDLSKFLMGEIPNEDEIEKDAKTVGADEFKSNIKSLGFGLKNNGEDVNSGGELNGTFLGIVLELLKDYQEIEPNADIYITSGNDNFHHNLEYESLHTKGRALDLTLGSQFHSGFKKLMDNYKDLYSGFGYIDEYLNPSDASTGPHFHLQYKG